MASSNKSEEVIGKLDKVADNLETATSQLSAVVTQQQLDVVRERISALEVDVKSVKSNTEVSSEKLNEQFDQIETDLKLLKELTENFEKDLSGLRALALTGFALSTITMISLIMCISYL